MNEIPKNTYEASEFLKKNKFTTELDDYFLDNNYIFDFFNQIKHPNLLKVFPHKVFCDEKSTKKCFTHDEKNIFYIDGHHLSNRGAELLVNEIIKVLGKNLG